MLEKPVKQGNKLFSQFVHNSVFFDIYYVACYSYNTAPCKLFYLTN